jgi:uncharacterized protein
MPYRFDWDSRKARANATKHGIEFDDAQRVFEDPVAIDWEDDREDYGEDRYVRLGIAEGRLLFVVYAMLDEETVRIISARKARPNERRKYHEGQG